LQQTEYLTEVKNKMINKQFKKQILAKADKYSELAIKANNKGNLKKGLAFEKKADKIYSDNYFKIFKKGN